MKLDSSVCVCVFVCARVCVCCVLCVVCVCVWCVCVCGVWCVVCVCVCVKAGEGKWGEESIGVIIYWLVMWEIDRTKLPEKAQTEGTKEVGSKAQSAIKRKM